uniref:Uncharacterized protein n=1 Tax=Nothobranchius furzeri TaxID=105023 RepID=A0A8C6NHG2_NOTFU
MGTICTSYTHCVQVRQIYREMIGHQADPWQCWQGHKESPPCSLSTVHDIYYCKIKMLKKPRFELGKLMELHGEGGSGMKGTWSRSDGREGTVQLLMK